MKLFKPRQDIPGQDDQPAPRQPYVMTALYARIVCFGCGDSVTTEMDACGRCGLHLKRPCGGCESVLAAGTRFCTHCGTVTA